MQEKDELLKDWAVPRTNKYLIELKSPLIIHLYLWYEAVTP